MSSLSRNYVAVGLLLLVRITYLWPCDTLSKMGAITKIYEGRPLENVSIATRDINECKINSSKLRLVNVLSWPLNVSDYFETIADQHLNHLYVDTCGIPQNCLLQLNTLNDYYFFVSTPPRGNSPLLKRVLRKSEPHSTYSGHLLSAIPSDDATRRKSRRKGKRHLCR